MSPLRIERMPGPKVSAGIYYRQYIRQKGEPALQDISHLNLDRSHP